MDKTKDKIKEELDKLIEDGMSLFGAHVKDPKNNLPKFHMDYQEWYTISSEVVRQTIPGRFDEFKAQYEALRSRKDLDVINYTISDYLQGIVVTRGTQEVFQPFTVFCTKFLFQIAILKAARKKIDAVLLDIENALQTNLFDSELEAANELCDKEFLRSAGVLGGVTLETHLAKLCATHNIIIKKPNATLADYNDLLKANGTFDVTKWRFVQHLGDIRNLCCHKKEREPTKDEVIEFLEGVKKITKTYY